MTRKDEIRRIELLAARIKPPAGLRPALSLHPEAGQLWRSNSAVADQEPLLFLVLEGPVAWTSDVYHAAPVHREVALAGPDDVIVSREVAGHRLVVCMGASVAISRQALSVNLGCLPDAWLEKLLAFGAWLSGLSEQRPDVLTGLQYLDQMDKRWVFKEELGRSLMDFQAFPAEEEALSSAGIIIQFPVFAQAEDELALAADSAVSAQRPLQSFVMATPDGALVRVSEAEHPGFVAVEVLRGGEISWPEAIVRDDDGQELARFDRAVAYFRLPASRRFKICTPDHPEGIPFSRALAPDDGDEQA